MKEMLYLVPVIGLLGLIFAFIKSSQISKEDEGTDEMKRIGKEIRDGF